MIEIFDFNFSVNTNMIIQCTSISRIFLPTCGDLSQRSYFMSTDLTDLLINIKTKDGLIKVKINTVLLTK